MDYQKIIHQLASQEKLVCLAKDELSAAMLKEENIEPNEILIKIRAGIFQKVLSDRPINYFTNGGYFRFHDVGFMMIKVFVCWRKK